MSLVLVRNTLVIISVILSLFVYTGNILAEPKPSDVERTPPPASPQECSQSFLGFPTWYQYLTLDADCNIDTSNSNTSKNYIPILIAMGILDILLYLSGIVAVLILMYGGFQYLTSTGDSSKISAAKTTITNAIIGVVIALVASQLVGFIAGRLTV